MRFQHYFYSLKASEDGGSAGKESPVSQSITGSKEKERFDQRHDIY